MTVEIITIGDELLIGQVVDTNSAWMGSLLNDNGFEVVHKTVTGDREEDIVSAVNAAGGRADVILITGGLGPTKDDVTLHALCACFDTSLRFSEEVYAHIEQLFSRRKLVMNELTRNQAMVPDKATVIRNEAGTAPCTWFERDGKVFVSMPGVPAEMKWLMTHEVIPRLKKRFRQDLYIKHDTCWVTGYTESALAIELSDFEQNLPSFVKLAYLPQAGMIRLRLSAYSRTPEEAETTLAALRKELGQMLHGHIQPEGDKEPEVLVGERLRARGQTVGTAESCTGGAIAAALTSVAGSSDYYVGSVVSYSNALKHRLLHVSETDLVRYGAVSRPVVEQMARGALQVLGCDYAVATSGIAGPGGGTAEKPVGTVWIAVAHGNDVVSNEFRFSSVREQNIRRAVNMSLIMLLNTMKHHTP
ncbi:CinA family nicotinamide mononucleotide deamidase-related protein [Tannerella sp.]|uniref:CinA family nicotinamide mononucleotide deamidase-related protein n=1 Tax=Tannerella sp. TaxID=2382127 RepID=UPI0026DBE077|nr:CinA family nicotinamide mononucleotide deamidase-related protein [Tannerella sp.]MDO4702934.1 CinA family nicotinamide mononucleotide deamidase-related protein [Tannerella sp.]